LKINSFLLILFIKTTVFFKIDKMCTRHDALLQGTNKKTLGCPHNNGVHEISKGINKNKQLPKKKWYSRFLRCGAQQQNNVRNTTAMEEDDAFWFKFYRAYDALCTPVILGEIERNTMDVKIIYANTAALDFTGYEPGEISIEFNPNGLIGRSVTELMEEKLSDSHAGYVANWLHRREEASSRTICTDSDSSRRDANKMKEVKGISRMITIVAKDGRPMRTDASLSFFTSSGLKKTVGIFSFKESEDLEILSLEGLSFNLEYKPLGSDIAYHVVVVPPVALSDFKSEKKWAITAVSAGIALTEQDKTIIKNLIRKQIFHHIGKILYGSGLDMTFVDDDMNSFSDSSMQQISATLMSAINDTRCRENMHLSCTNKEQGIVGSFDEFPDH
jgi:hypothetical protein